jgi:hypothetical protein
LRPSPGDQGNIPSSISDAGGRSTFPRVWHQNVWAEPQSLSEFGDENIY